MRLRIGVGHPGEKDKVTVYVLKRPSSDVEALVEKNVDEAVDMLPVLLADGLNAAMKKLHTKKQEED
jgi:PTH1 family peptidyl-tRNA hydrolase